MYICILYIWCYIIFKCLSVNQFDKTKLFRTIKYMLGVRW